MGSEYGVVYMCFAFGSGAEGPWGARPVAWIRLPRTTVELGESAARPPQDGGDEGLYAHASFRSREVNNDGKTTQVPVLWIYGHEE